MEILYTLIGVACFVVVGGIFYIIWKMKTHEGKDL